jgi:murein DD-endopeptidase MepM/ murein hydrolase activator NlpD
MSSKSFSEFLNKISKQPLRVLDASIPNSKYIPLDLSIANTVLEKIDISSATKFEHFINSYVHNNNGLVGFGGYNEMRNIYKRSSYFNENVSEARNIHLGIDLWIKAGTPIFCPVDATVHSFKNNTNYGDYGPTIILKHTLKNVEFYTLYGHLSLASLETMEVGKPIKKGDCFVTLGNAAINGDYPPHLHFQIIKDLQGFEGDYPGVCNIKDLEFYLTNCPNPELLLKLGV